MPHFDDAMHVVEDAESGLAKLEELHAECLAEKTIKSQFQIAVKKHLEALRSALDYCACGLFAKYGTSNAANPKIYFPYAKADDDSVKFRDEIVPRCIPGLSESRPDIVDCLDTYQFWGHKGNWLPLIARLANDNKHVQLTPQVQKKYKMVHITGTIPGGGSLTLDMTNIKLGGGPDATYHAVAGDWTGLEFEAGPLVMLLLVHATGNVRRIVEELSAM